MRRKRSEIYSPDEVAVVHVMAKTVRHMYLFGYDELHNTHHEHRRDWVEAQLHLQAKYFGIDLIAHAIMSNHFHLILCSRPDIVQQWEDTEVANRWLHLCPKRKDEQGNAKEPTEKELDKIRNNPTVLKKIRSRLSDISWWMRLACQKIAQRANWEIGETGHFFNGRFKAIRLLDEAAILACMVYVDLNPIRANVHKTIEECDHTSIAKRIKALNELGQAYGERADRHLRPIGERPSAQPDVPIPADKNGRCSNKGILKMKTSEYIDLVETTARIPRRDKPGFTPESTPPILERLGLDMETWQLWTQEFSSCFQQAAGISTTFDETQESIGRKFKLPSYRPKQSKANSDANPSA